MIKHNRQCFVTGPLSLVLWPVHARGWFSVTAHHVPVQSGRRNKATPPLS